MTEVRENSKVLQELKKEAAELDERMGKLVKALLSDGFLGKVGKMQFILMSKQLAGMQSYHDALKDRIVDLIAKETLEQGVKKTV